MSHPNTDLPELPTVLSDEYRVEALEKTGLLDEDTIENFDRLTRQAAAAVDASAAYVSLLRDDAQYLRGCVGLPEPLSSTRETPIEHSICAYTLDRAEPLVIDNTRKHPSLHAHPAVEEYGIEAYLGVPLRTADGHAIGTFCVVEWSPRTWTEEDINTTKDFAASAGTEIQLRLELTRRRETEQQLQARTNAFEALVDNLTDVVTILDASGTIQFESPSVERVTGYTPDELEGEAIWDYIHPDDQPKIRENMEAALEDPDREPLTEFRFRDADGSWRIFEARGRRLPDDVDLGTFISVSRDVTERRDLEERAHLLATAVENAESGVLITGPSVTTPGPRIQYVNEAMTEMTGYDRDDLVGNTPRILQGPETSRAVLDRLKDHLSEGRPVVDETINYRKDGTPYHVRWKIAPIATDEGEITHYVSVQEDITDEKELERELRRRVKKRTRELRTAKEEAERANRLKSALLANMSHEIRTPLTSVIGFAEAIGEETEPDDGPPADSSVADFAGLIAKSGKRLLDTLDGVLNLSKLEAGEMELEAKAVDLSGEIKQTVSELQPQADDAAVDLQVEASDEDAYAHADRKALQIALRNLVQNAIKYNQEEGSVFVRAYEDDETAVIEVEDTGIGIGDESQPEIFEAFKQESEGLGREYEGSGLGLAVTKQVIDQMSGSIDVESTKGEGTRFTVRLPRAHSNEDGDPAPPAESTS